MESLYQIYPFFFALIILSIGAWRVFNWVWLRPKRLEKCLRRQGFRGNRYRMFNGDKKDMSEMIKEARNSKPISLSDDILPKVVPHIFQTVKKYGRDYKYFLILLHFVWGHSAINKHFIQIQPPHLNISTLFYLFWKRRVTDPFFGPKSCLMGEFGRRHCLMWNLGGVA